jgi:hypothetical protein
MGYSCRHFVRTRLSITHNPSLFDSFPLEDFSVNVVFTILFIHVDEQFIRLD